MTGNSNVMVRPPPLIPPAGNLPLIKPSFTLEVWALLDDLNQNASIWDLAGYGDYGWVIRTWGGEAEWCSHQTGNPSIRPALNTPGWHHYAFTWDGDLLAAYLDGSQVGTLNNTDNTPAIYTLVAGAGQALGWGSFVGSIAKAALYDHALTPAQIATHYKAAFPAPAPSSYDLAVLSDSPVGYWPLSETAGGLANDTTGNAHDGLFSGGVTLSQPGIGDGKSSVLLDGTSGQVVIPHSAQLEPTQLSVECWINFTATPTGYPMFVCKNTGHGYVLYWNGGSGAVVNWQFDGSPILDKSPVNSGNWYHLVGTFDGTLMNLYRNGALVSGPNAFGHYTPNGGTLNIGSQAGTYFLPGKIAKVAVYDHALTPTQILAHYQAATG
jgi:hypothetical protein